MSALQVLKIEPVPDLLLEWQDSFHWHAKMTHFLFSSTVKHKPAVRCRVNTFIALFHYNIFCQTGCVKVVFGVAQFISLSWGVSSSTVKRKVNNQLPLNGIIRCCKSPLFFSPLPVLFSLPFHSGTMSICFHFFSQRFVPLCGRGWTCCTTREQQHFALELPRKINIHHWKLN